jgi:hypothetical protein
MGIATARGATEVESRSDRARQLAALSPASRTRSYISLSLLVRALVRD